MGQVLKGCAGPVEMIVCVHLSLIRTQTFKVNSIHQLLVREPLYFYSFSQCCVLFWLWWAVYKATMLCLLYLHGLIFLKDTVYEELDEEAKPFPYFWWSPRSLSMTSMTNVTLYNQLTSQASIMLPCQWYPASTKRSTEYKARTPASESHCSLNKIK